MFDCTIFANSPFVYAITNIHNIVARHDIAHNSGSPVFDVIINILGSSTLIVRLHLVWFEDDHSSLGSALMFDTHHPCDHSYPSSWTF